MRKKMAFSIILLLIILLTACSHKGESQVTDTADVQIYYIDTKTSKIVSKNYTPVETLKEQMVEELLRAMRQAPENMVYKNALPDNVTILGFDFSEANRLTIDFDTSYNDIVGIPEVLGRAMIVKTLSQIPGVESIEFTVNGQPLKDSSGTLVNFMTGEDFIENIGDEINYKIPIYFANEEGTALVEYISDIYYNGTGSIEEQVINQLINGPTQVGMNRTIPEGTTLLDVVTKDGICYVDFNEKFLEKLPDTSDEIPIYSVVDTLVELPNAKISKVQFSINGEVQKTYRENIAFDVFFERNLDLIENSQ